MRARQKIKYLYTLKIDDAQIIIRCAYGIKTKSVNIQNTFQHKTRYAQSKLQKKVLPEYDINSNMSTCNILKQHSLKLKHDPERLSTEFLQAIIGVKCNDK